MTPDPVAAEATEDVLTECRVNLARRHARRDSARQREFSTLLASVSFVPHGGHTRLSAPDRTNPSFTGSLRGQPSISNRGMARGLLRLHGSTRRRARGPAVARDVTSNMHLSHSIFEAAFRRANHGAEMKKAIIASAIVISAGVVAFAAGPGLA